MELSAMPRSFCLKRRTDTANALLRICTNANKQCSVGAISIPWKGHKKKEKVFDIIAIH